MPELLHDGRGPDPADARQGLSSSTIRIRAMASSVSPELRSSAMVSSPDFSRSLAAALAGPGGGGLAQGVGTLLRREGSQAH